MCSFGIGRLEPGKPPSDGQGKSRPIPPSASHNECTLPGVLAIRNIGTALRSRSLSSGILISALIFVSIKKKK